MLISWLVNCDPKNIVWLTKEYVAPRKYLRKSNKKFVKSFL